MVEEVIEGIFRIPVPLPRNPLKATNCYVIKGDSNLIIDTGFDRDDCWEALQAGLVELELDMERTDLFLTHLHADHVGLSRRLNRDGMLVFFNEPDATWFRKDEIWPNMIKFLELNGFPKGELSQVLDKHPGYKYTGDRHQDFTFVYDGDEIELGKFTFKVVHTPGHTAGHMCLYDQERKLLIAGDHILGDITPNIWLYSFESDPLGDYLFSLEKVAGLELDVILPGHRTIITEPQKRLKELKDFYLERIDEVWRILKEGPLTGYEVASRMRWDIRADNFDAFPTMQKWFATGEALANINYLAERDELEIEVGDVVKFLPA